MSRIVARLSAGARVTTPRYLTDCVVTEFGRADLRGLLERRADAQSIHALGQARGEAIRDRVVDEKALGRRADLAGVAWMGRESMAPTSDRACWASGWLP